MKRLYGFVTVALLVMAVELLLASPAHAQRRGRGRNNGNVDPGYYPQYQDNSSQYQPGYRYSYYQPTLGGDNGPARIELKLPYPNAQVYFDGRETRQRGATRMFTTPPLPGASTYQVSAVWYENGRLVTRERTVSVQPGATVTVDFTTNEE